MSKQLRILLIVLSLLTAVSMVLYIARFRGARHVSLSTKRISHIGAIPLGTSIEVPVDAQLVGMNILPCDTETAHRDVSYILISDTPVEMLREHYRNNPPNVNIQWMEDKPEQFTFVAFRQGMNRPRQAFLFSLSVFRGLSRVEGQALGLSEKEYRQKTFIFLIVNEPEATAGLIYLPTRFDP